MGASLLFRTFHPWSVAQIRHPGVRIWRGMTNLDIRWSQAILIAWTDEPGRPLFITRAAGNGRQQGPVELCSVRAHMKVLRTSMNGWNLLFGGE
jgi:hypothetical protein